MFDFHKQRIATHRNQSTAMMSPMSSSGRPTACSTIIVVIEPADGMPAAPIAIAVAVRLDEKKNILEEEHVVHAVTYM